MKKRIKLTEKQLLFLGLLTVIIMIILVALIIIISAITKVPFTVTVLVMLYAILGPTILYYILFYTCDIDISKSEEVLKGFLCKHKFTEYVYVGSNRHTNEGDMIFKIFQAEEIRFFAKLLESNNILLIAKNSNNNVIYNCKISNYYFFKNHFFVKECD